MSLIKKLRDHKVALLAESAVLADLEAAGMTNPDGEKFTEDQSARLEALTGNDGEID